MSDKTPWANWVPGALSYRQVGELIDNGYIECKADEVELDHSSMDLTLDSEAYVLPQGSVKPFGDRYLHQILKQGLAEELPLNDDGVFCLKRRCTYLVKVKEGISPLSGSMIYGQATAKSSIGRMDVLARLIVDGMVTYEEFAPDKIGNGAMFIEITPMTFNVKVKPGSSLTQLRFFKGDPRECEISSPSFFGTVIQNDPSNEDGSLSLDTSTVEIYSGGPEASAFMSRRNDDDDAYIELWGKFHTQPEEHWDIVAADENERIRIEPGHFYIMRSFERIAVPKGVAVYCRAIDETIGEMRIHYAGFAHPFFGYSSDNSSPGTPLVFEVRGHDVNVSLGAREKMAKLVFYRMSEDASPEDKPINDQDVYQHQNLQLSKFFSNWEEK